MGIAEISASKAMQDNHLANKLLGVGLYSVAEASAYTGIKAADIQRWLFGYQARGNHYPGLWESELADTGQQALAFRDLLEVRFVQAFRQHQVSLQTIRLAAAHAREMFRQDYPFTCKRFQTDGRSIFATIQEETGDESLLGLVKKQNVFRQVISPSLYEGIDYAEDAGSKALRWYPLKGSKAVVLDPARNFGKPILSHSGVDTEAIARAYVAENHDAKQVARLYEIPVNEVMAAWRYEQGLAA